MYEFLFRKYPRIFTGKLYKNRNILLLSSLSLLLAILKLIRNANAEISNKNFHSWDSLRYVIPEVPASVF